MLEEAPHELVRVQAHNPLLVVVSIVFPAKSDFIIADGQQAVVRYGDSVRVSAEILEHLGRTGKRSLTIDDPFGSPVALEPDGKSLRVAQVCKTPGERHSAGLKCLA